MGNTLRAGNPVATNPPGRDTRAHTGPAERPGSNRADSRLRLQQLRILRDQISGRSLPGGCPPAPARTPRRWRGLDEHQEWKQEQTVDPPRRAGPLRPVLPADRRLGRRARDRRGRRPRHDGARRPDLAMIRLLISGVCGLARCAQLRPPAASSRAVRLPLVLTGNPRNRPEAMLTDPKASPPPTSCAPAELSPCRLAHQQREGLTALAGGGLHPARGPVRTQGPGIGTARHIRTRRAR